MGISAKDCNAGIRETLFAGSQRGCLFFLDSGGKKNQWLRINFPRPEDSESESARCELIPQRDVRLIPCDVRHGKNGLILDSLLRRLGIRDSNVELCTILRTM